MLASLKYKLYNLYYYKHNKSTCIKFENTKYSRIDLICYIQKKLIIKNKNFSYLEIGVDKNQVFEHIITKNKVGVDPVSGGTHRMTSDEYFLQNKSYFDLVFIDGLHTYEQCKKDLINSIKVLNKNGLIVFHDFIPTTFFENHVPRISKTWTGDLWKLGLQLSKSNNCEFFVANFDHGIGILKVKENFTLKKIENVDHFTFSDFENLYYYNYPLRNRKDILSKIDELLD